MSIDVIFKLEDKKTGHDTYLTRGTLDIVPRVDEMIRFAEYEDQLRNEIVGVVTEVFHFMAIEEWSNYHHAYVFLRKI